MIPFRYKHWIVVVYLIMGVSAGRAQVKTYQEMITDEKELKVRIAFAAGLIELKKSSDNVIYRLKADGPNSDAQPVVRYTKNGSTGYLSVALESDNSLDLFDVGDIRWTMEITSMLPVYFQAEMGACKGQLNLTDIRLKDCQLTLGASTIKVLFETPNRERMRKLNVEAGLSKLKMYGLANANFEEMNFEGGIGNYLLNFSGLSKLESKVNIELGVGSLTMEIPNYSNVKLVTEANLFTSLSIDKDLFESKGDGVYKTKNHSSGLPGMEIFVDAGVGTIRVIQTP
jgi:hypothetical protein